MTSLINNGINYIIFLIFLTSYFSFSQTEEQLIKDNCDCTKTIDKDISIEQKKEQIMSCSLNAFKKNRSYTEKVVKEYTGKNSIDGNDVFLYLQDKFDYIMNVNCAEYRSLMAEILGATSLNSTVKEIGLKVCAEFNEDYSSELEKSVIEKVTNENKEAIIEEYGKNFAEQYRDDLNLFLFFNCDIYRLNLKKNKN